MDNIQPYVKQNKPGLYYVETDNYFPFSGNKFYPLCMVNYGLKEGIIKKSDIKYCIIASLSLPHHTYNQIIKFIMHHFGDHAKLAINSMVGAFAIKKENFMWKSEFILTDENQAFSHFLNKKGNFINMKNVDGDIYYHVFTRTDSINTETENPIYDMIINLEAIELHKMYKLIKSVGGIPIDLKTDAIRFKFDGDFPFKSLNNSFNIDGYYWDKECLIPKYKQEFKDSLKFNFAPKHIVTDNYMYIKKAFTLYNDVIDDDFTPLVNLCLDNLKNVFITGIAGSGKSTLIKKIVNEIKERGQECLILTPTNVS
jgi:hypothetical protein